MHLVVPAVLPRTREEFEEGVGLLRKINGIKRIQLDVVDGRFASPPSWPYSAEASFRRMLLNKEMLPGAHELEYEIDLMCLNPERAAHDWLELGARRLTFHVESVLEVSRLLKNVRSRYGTRELFSIGLAFNLATDQRVFEDVLPEVDYVQFMGIAKIGRQGQPFERGVLERVRSFRKTHPRMPVQVDGGVSPQTAKELLAAGVSDLIVGSAILKAKDPAEAFRRLEFLEHSV